MPVLTESGALLEKAWIYLEDNSDIVHRSNVILSFEHFKSKLAQIKESAVGIGVEIGPDFDVNDLQPYLSEIGLILLCFGVFSDGRAFSQASLLRSRFNYLGNIRATGDVIPDQLEFMQRCGFNQFQFDTDTDWRLAQKIIAGTSYCYQQTLDVRVAC